MSNNNLIRNKNNMSNNNLLRNNISLSKKLIDVS